MVDALSRKLHHLYEITYSQEEFNFSYLIREFAKKDLEYKFLWQKINQSNNSRKKTDYNINEKNLLTFRGRIYVPNQQVFRLFILDEFRKMPYVSHLSYQKIFSAIKKKHFWTGMRKYITEYLAKCL